MLIHTLHSVKDDNNLSNVTARLHGDFVRVSRDCLFLLALSVCLSLLAISASFERGTSVTYTLQEPFSVMQNQDAKRLQSSIRSVAVKSRENVAFGFMTSHAQVLLLTAQSYDRRYMAITLNANGKT